MFRSPQEVRLRLQAPGFLALPTGSWRPRAIAVLAFIALGQVTVPARLAHACSCSIPDLAEIRDDADLVFTGRVVGITPPSYALPRSGQVPELLNAGLTTPWSDFCRLPIILFAVEQRFKGSRMLLVAARMTHRGGSECPCATCFSTCEADLPLPGQEWLVFAARASGAYYVSDHICSGNQVMTPELKHELSSWTPIGYDLLDRLTIGGLILAVLFLWYRRRRALVGR